MKNRKLILILFLFITILFSCKKVNRLTNFYAFFDYDLSIDSYPNTAQPINIWMYQVGVINDDLFLSNNSYISETKSITLSTVVLSIVSPDSLTIDFVKSIEIYVASKGHEKKKIAWLEDISNTDDNSISLITSDDDIQAYILDKNFVFQLIIETTEPQNRVVCLALDYSVYINTNLIST